MTTFQLDQMGPAKLDMLGRFYVGFTSAWTAVLAAGIIYLIINRERQFLRIRNIPLGIAAVCVLHVYWVLGMMVYVFNGHFPCSAEFWIMSVYLPLGIALYQANSTQILHVAGLQKQYISTVPVTVNKRNINAIRSWKGLILKWKTLTITQRAMTLITIGTCLQVRLNKRLLFSLCLVSPKKLDDVHRA